MLKKNINIKLIINGGTPMLFLRKNDLTKQEQIEIEDIIQGLRGEGAMAQSTNVSEKQQAIRQKYYNETRLVMDGLKTLYIADTKQKLDIKAAIAAGNKRTRIKLP